PRDQVGDARGRTGHPAHARSGADGPRRPRGRRRGDAHPWTRRHARLSAATPDAGLRSMPPDVRHDARVDIELDDAALEVWAVLHRPGERTTGTEREIRVAEATARARAASEPARGSAARHANALAVISGVF